MHDDHLDGHKEMGQVPRGVVLEERETMRRLIAYISVLAVLLCLWTVAAHAITLSPTDDTYVQQASPTSPSGGTATSLLVPHPLLILGYSRFNFVRASSILNCQSTPRCLALVLSAQIPISAWSKGSSPMRRSVRH